MSDVPFSTHIPSSVLGIGIPGHTICRHATPPCPPSPAMLPWQFCSGALFQTGYQLMRSGQAFLNLRVRTLAPRNWRGWSSEQHSVLKHALVDHWHWWHFPLKFLWSALPRSISSRWNLKWLGPRVLRDTEIVNLLLYATACPEKKKHIPYHPIVFPLLGPPPAVVDSLSPPV